MTLANAIDLLGDLGLALFQLGHACFGIGGRALDDLAQQLEDRDQARLGADELTLAQAGQPSQGLLGGRRQVEVRLVAVRWVVLAQPAAILGRPLVEIIAGAAGKCAVAQALAQME